MNLTPDSFSDGGELASEASIVERARCLVGHGADALDLGGESTRPGSASVPEAEQITRVVPAIAAIRQAEIVLPITVDTTRAAVAIAALNAGADAVNDVSGGTDDAAMLPMLAKRGAGVILMHRLTVPASDSYSTDYKQSPVYEDGVVAAVDEALGYLFKQAVEAGIVPESILLDPGLGFGKSVEQNNEVLAKVGTFAGRSAGVLVGASRKSFLSPDGRVPPAQRDPLSVQAALTGLAAGARCFRVHNVKAHREVLDKADTV